MRSSLLVVVWALGACSANDPLSLADGQTSPPRNGGEHDAAPQATLLFASGFEGGVEVGAPYVVGNSWRQSITGLDSMTGFDWAAEVPLSEPHFLYLVAPADGALEQFVDTRVETIPGRDGTATRALRMEVKDDAPTHAAYTRNTFKGDPGTLQQAYQRYWVKLQDDYREIMPEGRTRMILEWKEEDTLSGTADTNFRISVYVAREGSHLVFSVVGEQRQPEARVDWQCLYGEHTVDGAEWFLVEVFWRHSAGEDGRFWMALDGETACDHRGRTSHETNPTRFVGWNLFKVYPFGTWYQPDDPYSLAGPNTMFQWVDDLEIWSEPPEGL